MYTLFINLNVKMQLMLVFVLVFQESKIPIMNSAAVIELQLTGGTPGGMPLLKFRIPPGLIIGDAINIHMVEMLQLKSLTKFLFLTPLLAKQVLF